VLKTTHPTPTSYTDYRFALMVFVEGNFLSPYSDSTGLPTIGIGVTFRANFDQILAQLGIPAQFDDPSLTETETASLAETEQGFVQQIRDVVFQQYARGPTGPGTDLLRTRLNDILSVRFLTYIGLPGTRQEIFTLTPTQSTHPPSTAAGLCLSNRAMLGGVRRRLASEHPQPSSSKAGVRGAGSVAGRRSA
jgi:hypothetical protein